MIPASVSCGGTIGLLAACTIALGGCGGDELGRTFGFTHDAPDEFSDDAGAAGHAADVRAATAPARRDRAHRSSPNGRRPSRRWCRRWPWARFRKDRARVSRHWSRPPDRPYRQAFGPWSIRLPSQAKPSEGFVDKLMFWRKPAQPGIVVDPQKEGQRLRENAALGQSQETGDTPIIQPSGGDCWKGSSRGTGTGLDAPHFIQVGDAPAFIGVGGSDLICRCGQSTLIKGYLPANFLAIRIRCFRCGAITGTPGLPDGEILPRSAVSIEAKQAPVVASHNVGRGVVLACQDETERVTR